MSEETITCKECTGGFVDDDGLRKPCPVCDGDPVITFATVKEYSRQIGYFSRKLWLAESELETVRRQLGEALARVSA